MCGEALKEWLFDDDVKVGLMSYKEELVDSKSPDALFWKIDYYDRTLTAGSEDPADRRGDDPCPDGDAR